jgi:hypothetical protein
MSGGARPGPRTRRRRRRKRARPPLDPVAKLAAFHLYRAAMAPRLERGDLTEEALFAEFVGFIGGPDDSLPSSAPSR